MSTHRTRTRSAANEANLTPQVLTAWLSAFRDCFTAPVWKPRPRACCRSGAGARQAHGKPGAAGHGAGGETGFRTLPRGAEPGALGRTRRHAQAPCPSARRLPARGEVVIGIDDTIERRWGAKIKARGIYRDPVRSSHGHFVKASGLRWLSLMVMVPIPWVGRCWALPFLTVLAPSERWSSEHGRRHKTLTD